MTTGTAFGFVVEGVLGADVALGTTPPVATGTPLLAADALTPPRTAFVVEASTTAVLELAALLGLVAALDVATGALTTPAASELPVALVPDGGNTARRITIASDAAPAATTSAAAQGRPCRASSERGRRLGVLPLGGGGRDESKAVIEGGGSITGGGGSITGTVRRIGCVFCLRGSTSERIFTGPVGIRGPGTTFTVVGAT